MLAAVVLSALLAQAPDVSQAVAACVQEVRRLSPSEPHFEAFFDPRLRRVDWLGSDREGFYFRRCMLTRGLSIADTPPTRRPAPKEIRQ